MTKETFIQTMELLQKQPNYESDLARELLNTLKRAFPDTYVFLKNDEKKVISSLFSAIRNALAHGSFNVKRYEKTRIYYFSNYKGYEKARIVLYEDTLLSWIDIIEKESR